MPRRVVAIGVVLAAAAALAVAAEGEDALRAAIARAQQRCARIYGGGAGREHGYATGLIVSPNGHILTAQGIYLTEGRLRVVLPDGSRHEAEILRRSETLQTALLKVEADTPHYFELSDESPVEQGDWVLAVSNLFNVAAADEPLSVTMGVVSLRAEITARHRAQDVPYEGELLLIDAITSNPGAPGGALITLDGTLAGMLGKLFQSKSTNTRINYAVPVELLKPFVVGETTPKVAGSPKPTGPPYIGLRLFTLTGKRAPAYVDRVRHGSPAREAGIRKDDLILGVAGTVVRNCRDYEEAVEGLAPGKPVVFLIKRKTAIQQVTVTPAAREEDGDGR
ncbi:MAG: S1C family serine protease [Planctomycetota bacterium]